MASDVVKAWTFGFGGGASKASKIDDDMASDVDDAWTFGFGGGASKASKIEDGF